MSRHEKCLALHSGHLLSPSHPYHWAVLPLSRQRKAVVGANSWLLGHRVGTTVSHRVGKSSVEFYCSLLCSSLSLIHYSVR